LQGKELQVGKRKIGKYPRAFREMAVARMRCCDSVKELAQELGVGRTALYQWRDQLAPQDRGEWQAEEKVDKSRLEQENRELKQALAEKTLEVDFFKGALQKVAARRQGNSATGETASTTKSGS
jgi:transposase-like protein